MLRLIVSGCAGLDVRGWSTVGPFDGADLRLDPGEREWPLADGVVDCVYVRDVVEFLSPEQCETFFREVRRVVRPGGLRESADGSAPFEGGLVRVVFPDMPAALRAAADREVDFFAVASAARATKDGTWAERLSRWLYAPRADGRPRAWAPDDESIAALLKRAGFEGVYRAAGGKSLHPAMREVTRTENMPDVLFSEAWRSAEAARRAA
ncbi:MAG: class I SAM-dependent methyltransferase [Planctomycetota bacterium]|nr:class I SAM-dependent methyltransferase [Planctomycetota bacterium]